MVNEIGIFYFNCLCVVIVMLIYGYSFLVLMGKVRVDIFRIMEIV